MNRMDLKRKVKGLLRMQYTEDKFIDKVVELVIEEKYQALDEVRTFCTAKSWIEIQDEVASKQRKLKPNQILL